MYDKQPCLSVIETLTLTLTTDPNKYAMNFLLLGIKLQPSHAVPIIWHCTVLYCMDSCVMYSIALQ